MPGKCGCIDPSALGITTERSERAGHRLTDSNRTRFELDEELMDHAEAGSRPQCLDFDHAVAEHDVVDAPGDHEPRRLRQPRLERGLDRFSPGFTIGPEVAPAQLAQLGS